LIARIIHLSENDDAASVADNLEWANANRVVLVVPPGSPLRTELDFARITRAARASGCEAAIVSGNRSIRALANEVGLASFASMDNAATREWMGSDDVEPLTRQTAPRRFQPNSLRRFFPSRNWFGIASSILIGLVTLGVMGLAIAAIVPSATITLTADKTNVSAIVPVSLDTAVTRPSATTKVVPAQRVDVVVGGAMTVPATGKKDVPKFKATGQVTFFNILAQPYTVPRNTVVRSSATGNVVRFITLGEVALAPGGQGSVGIEAIEEGSSGNVPANTINVIEGVPSIAARAINLGGTGGGGGETVSAVTNDDFVRARAALRRQLVAQASDLMAKNEKVVNNGLYVLPDTMFVADVQDESFDRFVGEQAQNVTLNMRLQIAGLAIQPTDLDVIARGALASRVPRGFDLLDVSTERGSVAEEGGSDIEYFVNASGIAGTRIDEESVKKLVRGKSPAEAIKILSGAYPLKSTPKIVISPDWLAKMLDRIPLAPMRINVKVVRE